MRVHAARVLLLLITGFCSLISVPQAATPDTALDAYRKRNFRSSQNQYSELAKQQPEDPRLRFNAGAAAYRNQDLTNAAAWFESVLGAPDLELQQRAYYNLGNTRFREGERAQDAQQRMRAWQESLQHFGSALKLNQADTNAAGNLSYVRQKLEELKQQMPPPQPQPQGDQGEQDNSENQPDQPPQKGEPQDQSEQQRQQQQQQAQSGEEQPQPQDGQQGEPQQPEQADAGEPGKKPGAEEQKQDQAQAAEQTGQADGQENAGESGEEFAAAEGEPGQMSVVQAERLLDQQKDDAKALLFSGRGTNAPRSRLIRKPW